MVYPTLSYRLSGEQIAKTLKHWPGALKLNQVSRHYDVRVFHEQQGEYVEHTAIPDIVLHKGGLYIDGKPVANPHFGRGFVRFVHNTATGFTSGVLNFTQDGLSFTGTLYRGATQATAEPLSVSGVSGQVVYKTRLAKTGAVPGDKDKFPAWRPSEPTDAAQWEVGLELVLGYEHSEGGGIPEFVVELRTPGDPEGALDISYSCAPSVVNENLVVQMLLTDQGIAQDGAKSYGNNFPAGFSAEVNWDAMSFRGMMQHYDPNAGQISTTQVAWLGTAVPAAEPKKVAANVAAAAPAVEAVLGVDLRLDELFTLQPDAQRLQQDQWSTLVENMKWGLANNDATSTWVSTFFGETAPTGLSKERTDLITKDRSFYTDRLAVAYLGSSFNKMTGTGAPATKLSDNQKLNLDFYLRAGLACEKSYTEQSQGTFLHSFIMAQPRLQDYIRDQNANDPAHDWAQQLYNQITTPQTLTTTVMKILASHGMEEPNRLSTVLQALQPSGDLASKYQGEIANATMTRAIEHLNLNDKEAVKKWLKDSIEGFVNAFQSGKLNLEGMDPETKAKLTAIADDLAKAAKEAGGFADLASALTDLTIAVGGANFWEKLANAQGVWAQRGYKFANGIYALAMIGGLFAAVMSFMNWDKLKPEEKATVVFTMVQITARIVKNVPGIVTKIGEKIGEKWSANQIGKVYRGCAEGAPKQMLASEESLLLSEEETVSSYGAINMGRLANTETKTLELEGSAWVQTFEKTVGKLCEGLAAVAAVWFAFDSMNQLAEDIASGASARTIALDAVIMAANIGVAVCAVVGLFAAATFIPVVGAIFAIIGIIATLIELFLPPEPKPTPVELFMRNNMMSALEGAKRWILDAPTGWTVDSLVPLHHAYNPAAA